MKNMIVTSGMKILIILTVLFCSGYALSEVDKLTFSEGIYRQDGTCKRLIKFGDDRTSQCHSLLGVLVKKKDLPEFMFRFGETPHKFIVFLASGTANYSNENTLITYPVDQVLDTGAGLFYQCAGECTINMRADNGEEIKCTTWKDKAHEKICFEGRFFGSGMWMYKPNHNK